MNQYILDTSVAIAWYLPESFSEKAKRWQRSFLQGSVEYCVPSLHFLEFANVLRTYVRRDELDLDLAREIFSIHSEATLTVIEPQRRALLDVALKYETTVYDAVYIALSLEHKMPILTAEKTTTPWVTKLGKSVVSVHA